MHHVDERRWVLNLAPQLSGWAQQAYAAMHTEEDLVYTEVKKAILRRYNINEEQRFRAFTWKEGEPYIELVTRKADIFHKWTTDCTTMEAFSKELLIEQLLNNMPAILHVSLSDKEPSTSKEAGRLADDYVLAWKHSHTSIEVPTLDPRKQTTPSTRNAHRSCCPMCCECTVSCGHFSNLSLQGGVKIMESNSLMCCLLFTPYCHSNPCAHSVQ